MSSTQGLVEQARTGRLRGTGRDGLGRDDAGEPCSHLHLEHYPKQAPFPALRVKGDGTGLDGYGDHAGQLLRIENRAVLYTWNPCPSRHGVHYLRFRAPPSDETVGKSICWLADLLQCNSQLRSAQKRFAKIILLCKVNLPLANRFARKNVNRLARVNRFASDLLIDLPHP